MTKKILWALAVVLFPFAGTCYADTLTGKVQSIDNAGNSLVMVSERSDAVAPTEYKLVWDETFVDQPKLDNANIGDLLTVDADQNAVTRTWKVQSVKGPLANAEKALLRTEDRVISGEVTNIDTAAASLVLMSKDTDAAGQPISYSVVWDKSDTEIQEHLGKSKVGDKLTLTADQNMLTQNWRAKSISGPIEAMIDGGAKTLTGQVKSVDRDKNFIVLTTTEPSGNAVERKLVWDDNFKQQAALENAKVGEKLSVRADQNMITRNWKVQAIG